MITLRIDRIGFELTNRCDLRCKICTIWKTKEKKDLTLDDVDKVLSLPQIHFPLVSLTGGEPLLNPYITCIYRHLFSLYLKSKIKGVNISTNAYSSKIIDFLEKNKKRLAPLSINVSLDGFSNTHNIQRGRRNAFQKTIEHISEIKKYKVPLALKCVISSINYQDLWNVYILAKKMNCSLKIDLFEKIKNYYHRYSKKIVSYNPTEKHRIILNKMLKKIKKLEQKDNYHTVTKMSLLHTEYLLENINAEIVKKYILSAGCYKSLFITVDKKIYSNIYYSPIGSISAKNTCINWVSFEKIKKRIIKSKKREYLSLYSYLRQP